MKTKNIAVIGLAVLLMLVLYNRVVYSSMGSQAAKANQAAEDAESRVKTLQSQVRLATGGESGGKSKGATLEELQNAIPASPALSTFLRSADNIRIASGVTFQSIVPTQPNALGGVSSINLGITVQGGYREVTDYVNRLNKLTRLVLVDNVSVTAGAAATGAAPAAGGPAGPVFAGQGAAPSLQLQLSARLFTLPPGGTVLGASPVGAPGTATRPATGSPTAPGVQNS
jgi:Tfp pilus assembly protein PilO